MHPKCYKANIREEIVRVGIVRSGTVCGEIFCTPDTQIGYRFFTTNKRFYFNRYQPRCQLFEMPYMIENVWRETQSAAPADEKRCTAAVALGARTVVVQKL